MFRIAQAYLKALSIDRLKQGDTADKKFARYLDDAGITQADYDRMIAADLRQNRMSLTNCRHPLLYYELRVDDIAINGYGIVFVELRPADNSEQYHKVMIYVTLSFCGAVWSRHAGRAPVLHLSDRTLPFCRIN